MFDLEQAIAAWRQQMSDAGMKSPEVLAELESHLREQLAAVRSLQISDEQAFASALQQLGNPGDMQREFNKVHRVRWWPGMIAMGLWASATIALGIFLLLQPKIGAVGLLWFHNLTLVAGYLAALFAGALGFACAVGRISLSPSTARSMAFHRTVTRFTLLAAALIGVGVVLGISWSALNNKPMFGGGRAIGPFAAAIWFSLFAWMLRQMLTGDRAVASAAIVGNLVITAALIAPALWIGGAPGYGIVKHPMFMTVVAAHLAGMLMLALPQRAANPQPLADQ